MKINEVDDAVQPPANPAKLLGLIEFLAGRADDTTARKEISQDALIKLAQSLRININRQNLPDLTNQPPLDAVVEPLQPDSDDPVVYKGGKPADIKMPTNQAQDIVAKAAKSALQKRS